MQPDRDRMAGMETELVIKSELDVFKCFIDEHCDGSLNGHSLAEAIEDFREYQRQLTSLQEKLRLSDESGDRDGTRVLTDKHLDELCDRWEADLKEEGVIE